MQIWNVVTSSARSALTYITVGCLGLVWTGVWCLYLVNNRPVEDGLMYVVGGFGVTSLMLLGIGLGYGYVFPDSRPAIVPATASDVPQVAPTVPGNVVVTIAPAPAAVVPAAIQE